VMSSYRQVAPLPQNSRFYRRSLYYRMAFVAQPKRRAADRSQLRMIRSMGANERHFDRLDRPGMLSRPRPPAWPSVVGI
jgi:hypothetical protein